MLGIMLRDVIPSFIMLSFIMQNVVILCEYYCTCHYADCQNAKYFTINVNR
jgi:hypothetical protein